MIGGVDERSETERSGVQTTVGEDVANRCDPRRELPKRRRSRIDEIQKPRPCSVFGCGGGASYETCSMLASVPEAVRKLDSL